MISVRSAHLYAFKRPNVGLRPILRPLRRVRVRPNGRRRRADARNVRLRPRTRPIRPIGRTSLIGI